MKSREELPSCQTASLGPDCFSAWLSKDEGFLRELSCSHLCKVNTHSFAVPAQLSHTLADSLALRIVNVTTEA